MGRSAAPRAALRTNEAAHRAAAVAASRVRRAGHDRHVPLAHTQLGREQPTDVAIGAAALRSRAHAQSQAIPVQPDDGRARRAGHHGQTHEHCAVGCDDRGLRQDHTRNGLAPVGVVVLLDAGRRDIGREAARIIAGRTDGTITDTGQRVELQPTLQAGDTLKRR